MVDLFEISERDGLKYKVSFEVRAKNNRTGENFDEEIIYIWNQTGGHTDVYFNLLEKLVNQDLPNATAGLV